MRPESNNSEEAQSLLGQVLNQSAKTFSNICKSYPGKIGEGAINGIVGGIVSGMSYQAENGMMALHAMLGTAWGLNTLKAFSEGVSALSNNDKNVHNCEVEIRVFKELMKLQGEERSVKPITDAINNVLKEKGAPELSEEIIQQLTDDPQEKSFDDLIRKISDVNSRNLLVAVSLLGIVSTVAGFTVMETYKNDLPETVFTAVAAAGTSLSSGFLNATASSSADISGNTYNALKNLNDGLFAGLKPQLAEEGRTSEIAEDISEIRERISKERPTTVPKNKSHSKVLVAATQEIEFSQV